jgi:hypothetical protein
LDDPLFSPKLDQVVKRFAYGLRLEQMCSYFVPRKDSKVAQIDFASGKVDRCAFFRRNSSGWPEGAKRARFSPTR